MRIYKNKIIRIFVAFLFCFGYFVPVASVDAKEATTILELKEQLEDLKQQKQKQATAKAQTQSEINSKKNSIYRAYKEKETVHQEVEDAKNKVVESEKAIEEASKDIDEVLKYYQLMDSNGNEYFEYITSSSSTTELIMRMTAVEQITTYYKDRINSLNDLITEKQNLQVELNNKNNELDQKIDNFSDALEELNEQMDVIDEVSEDIDTQIKAQEQTLKYYQSICDSETQKLSTCTNDPQSYGWLKPLNKGRITQPFGYVGGSFHSGIDIGGNAEGTAEYASAAGRVAAITYKSSCGGNIVYLHVTVNGKRYTVQYAHMKEIKVQLNQMVTTGTVIGTVGGYSTSTYYNKGGGGYDNCAYGAHLHYGIATGWYHVDYNSWSKFVANLINPPGFPNKGVWWYKR